VEEVDGEAVQVGLPGEGGDHGVRVPEELLDRTQEAARGLDDPPGEAMAGAVEGLRVEGVVPRGVALRNSSRRSARTSWGWTTPSRGRSAM